MERVWLPWIPEVPVSAPENVRKQPHRQNALRDCEHTFCTGSPEIYHPVEPGSEGQNVENILAPSSPLDAWSAESSEHMRRVKAVPRPLYTLWLKAGPPIVINVYRTIPFPASTGSSFRANNTDDSQCHSVPLNCTVTPLRRPTKMSPAAAAHGSTRAKTALTCGHQCHYRTIIV